jgi:hypothetical protein
MYEEADANLQSCKEFALYYKKRFLRSDVPCHGVVLSHYEAAFLQGNQRVFNSGIVWSTTGRWFGYPAQAVNIKRSKICVSGNAFDLQIRS